MVVRISQFANYEACLRHDVFVRLYWRAARQVAGLGGLGRRRDQCQERVAGVPVHAIDKCLSRRICLIPFLLKLREYKRDENTRHENLCNFGNANFADVRTCAARIRSTHSGVDWFTNQPPNVAIVLQRYPC